MLSHRSFASVFHLLEDIGHEDDNGDGDGDRSGVARETPDMAQMRGAVHINRHTGCGVRKGGN